MTLLQHYQLGLYLTTAVTWTLGFLLLLQQPRNKVARIFTVYALAVGYWSLCQAQAGTSDDPRISLIWVRAMFHAVVAFPVLLIHFFSAFLDINRKKVCAVGWVCVAALYPFLNSEWFLRPGGPVGFLATMPRASGLFLAFNLGWFAWIAYDISLFLLRSRKPGPSAAATPSQIRILFFAFLFGYATGSTNYLYFYGLYLPLLQPFATYGVVFAFLVIAYGVFAYRLFDVSVVIKKSLVYSALVTLLTIGYFGLVYGIERAFQTTFGYHSVWVSLAAFALMALAFQPLKVWTQRGVDWLIFRVPQEELVKRVERLEQEALQTEKFKAVSTLAAGMAHEIKNPLTAIKAFAESIPEYQNDPEFLKDLHRILTEQVRHIQGIVQDVLDFAKPKPPRIEPVDLGALISSTVNFLSGNLLKNRIRWTVTCQHNGATLQADADQLRQVLINLIQNAGDAMPSGGKLTITTQTNRDRLEIIISDTGKGIRKDLLPKIFDPYVTTKEHGNGLGLAMVQSIIHAHRGSIRAESAPGRGTTFTIELPI